MAFFQMSFFSTSLRRTVPVNVILPAENPFGFPGQEPKPYKTLYLLHGYMGNYMDWITGTSVAQYAQMFNIAVVMPSGDNSFYVDYAGSGVNYGEYIGRELVEFTRKVFPLSHKREDTLIGGLSMGGFGALRNGLKYGETFGHTIALSSAFVIDNAAQSSEEPNAMGIGCGYFKSIFGDLSKVNESDYQPRWLAKNIMDEGREYTNLFLACGFNDMLVYANRSMHEYLDSIGFKHEYQEGPGTHEWAFWDSFLKKGLEHALGKLPDMKGPFWVDAEIKA